MRSRLLSLPRRTARGLAALGVCLAAAVPAAAQDTVVGQVGPVTVMPVQDANWANEGIQAHFAQVDYPSARAPTEALRRSRQTSPDALARTLKSMGEIDVGGLPVNFAKSNVGSRFVDIAVVTSQGRLMY